MSFDSRKTKRVRNLYLSSWVTRDPSVLPLVSSLKCWSTTNAGMNWVWGGLERKGTSLGDAVEKQMGCGRMREEERE